MCDNALITAFGYQRNPVDDKIIKEVIKDLRGMATANILQVENLFCTRPWLGFGDWSCSPRWPSLMPKEIPPVRTEILTAKVPALPPAAETVKEPADAPPVKVAPKANRSHRFLRLPATGSDKSVSEIIPPAPVQSADPGRKLRRLRPKKPRSPTMEAPRLRAAPPGGLNCNPIDTWSSSAPLWTRRRPRR